MDTGPPLSAPKVLWYIRSIGRRPEELDHILITHSHPDHTTSALPLVRQTGAVVVAHAGDSRAHSGRGRYLSYVGLLNRLREHVPLPGGTPVSHTVEEGDLLPMHGGVKVVYTPGHTPGSVCYLLREQELLFSGIRFSVTATIWPGPYPTRGPASAITAFH